MASLSQGSASDNGITVMTNGFIRLITNAAADATNAQNSIAAINTLANSNLTFSRYLPVGGNTTLLRSIKLTSNPVTQLETATTILVNGATNARGDIHTSVVSLANLAAQL